MTTEINEGKVFLVTGGAGYIGSQLIRDLAKNPSFPNATIRIYDNLQRKQYYALMDLPQEAQYEFIEGDILDRINLRRAMQNVDAIFHLAAISSTPLSFDHPEWTEQVNHWGTSSVVECALAVGVPDLIYSSSASVYGPGGPFKETDTCRPVGPYAISKRKGEEVVLWGHERGLATTIIRLGTTFGNAPVMRFDAVANRLTFLVGVGRPIIIHGDGNQIRPLIHIQDASLILQHCLTNLTTRGKILNAVLINPSINDIAQTLQSLVPDTTVRYTDQDILTQVSFAVDSSKLQDLLNYKPKFDLKDGLIDTLARWQGFQATQNSTVPFA